VPQTTQPLISIIIPTYNYGEYLSKAIQSVLAQNENCELIIIDDGSTDNTQEIIKNNYDDSKLSYIYQENAGVSSARNHGISIAKGDYLLFLDADDSLLPNAISVLTSALGESPGKDCYIAGHISVNTSGAKKVHLPKALSEDNKENFVNFIRKKIKFKTTGAVFFSKKICANIRFPESINNNEDIVFMALVLSQYQCTTINNPVVEVLKHPGSLRHNMASVIDSTNKVAELLFNADYLPTAYMKYKDEFASYVLLSRFRSLYLANRKKEAKELYHRAIRLYPKNIFIFGYLKKYIRC